jgi:SAM-dependent methyltransferase
MELIEAVFNDLHTNYETKSNIKYYKTIAEQIINYIESLIYKKDVSNIIDLCCGTGILTKKLSAAYPKAEIIGLDISGQMLGVARQKTIENVRWIQYDVNDFGKLDLKTNIITCSYGIQWLKKDIIYDISNSLSDGGVFICSLPGYTLGNIEMNRRSVEYTGNMLFKVILDLSKRRPIEKDYPKKIIKDWSKRVEGNDIIDIASNCGLKMELHTTSCFLTEFESVQDMVYSIISRGTFGNVLSSASEDYMHDLSSAVEHFVVKYNNMIEENVTEYILFSK